MAKVENCRTSVSALLGASVTDSSGVRFGRVTEFAVQPTVDASRVEALVVRRASASRSEQRSLVPITSLALDAAGNLQILQGAATSLMPRTDEYLLLDRDLLDQQIIDVNGHKVVRVNDVDLVWEQHACGEPSKDGEELRLKIAEVEVGVRGAVRRLLKGLPAGAIDSLADRITARVIPWDFVDLIDRDPSRRVRLKIEQDRLSKMHPSDLADILEELGAAESQALFTSLDNEVAAEALEEVELKTQMQLIESLDSEQVAEIMDEMDPDAAADLLSELPEARSDAILEEMGEKERDAVEELLEHDADSAAGLMTTEFLALPVTGTVADAIEAIREFSEPESLTDVFLLDGDGRLVGMAPLSRLMLAPGNQPLAELHEGRVVSAHLEQAGAKVAEKFDKYNLRCLPVLDDDKQMAGVIHAEHVIAWLRTER